MSAPEPDRARTEVTDARTEVTDAQIDAVMLAAQALVGVTAQSVAEVEHLVTLPQLRVLVLVASHGTLNLNALAQAMGIHPSNATRACDRLVAAGLLKRRDSEADRRNLVLELTDQGRQLVESIVARRRAAIAAVLARVPAHRRRSLVTAMRTFAQDAGEIPVGSAWKLGWPS
jgi:DNA-binding MarR family transcriptional regulator